MSVNLLVSVNQKVEVSIEIDDIIDSLNALPLFQRFNKIAKILNAVEASKGELTYLQRTVIIEYLEKQLTIFKNEPT